MCLWILEQWHSSLFAEQNKFLSRHPVGQWCQSVCAWHFIPEPASKVFFHWRGKKNPLPAKWQVSHLSRTLKGPYWSRVGDIIRQIAITFAPHSPPTQPKLTPAPATVHLQAYRRYYLISEPSYVLLGKSFSYYWSANDTLSVLSSNMSFHGF